MEDQLLLLLDVVIAAVLAGLVGLERELAQKPAGFRTQMIIGGASCLLIVLGEVLIVHFEALSPPEILRIDPIRIMEAIIVGISFIGAGTILKQRGTEGVLYLTTAATILFSAGIGISVGLKQYILAIGLVILILLINRFAAYLDRKVKEADKEQEV